LRVLRRQARRCLEKGRPQGAILSGIGLPPAIRPFAGESISFADAVYFSRLYGKESR